MEIILLERVAKLGALGQVVKVKDGFARNFLLPRHKALRANAANLKSFEVQRAEIEVRNVKNREAAVSLQQRGFFPASTHARLRREARQRRRTTLVAGRTVARAHGQSGRPDHRGREFAAERH